MTTLAAQLPSVDPDDRCESVRRGAGGGDEGYFEVRCELLEEHAGEHRAGETTWDDA